MLMSQSHMLCLGEAGTLKTVVHEIIHVLTKMYCNSEEDVQSTSTHTCKSNYAHKYRARNLRGGLQGKMKIEVMTY